MKPPVGVGVGLGVGMGVGISDADGVGVLDAAADGEAVGTGVEGVGAGEVAAEADLFAPLPPQPARAVTVARESAITNAAAEKTTLPPPGRDWADKVSKTDFIEVNLKTNKGIA